MHVVTKAEAFARRSDERDVAIKPRTIGKFRFTRKWFRQRNQKTWSTFLLPQFGNGRPIKMVQIGVFEGMDLVWCCQHLLQHPASAAVAIDPWAATRKLDATKMAAVLDNARHNLSPWSGKIEILRGYSEKLLPALPYAAYDLVVVDGDHNADPVYRDAVESLRIVKPGGWIVFDDVRNRIEKADHVIDGLTRFVDGHADQVEFKWAHRYCDCYERRIVT